MTRRTWCTTCSWDFPRRSVATTSAERSRHAIQHGYQLQRRREWQRLFGKSSKRYPEYYRPNPASKRYVQHLRLWYAQSHPDEDFAETFAVWLRPRGEWRKRYAEWPALRKLEYVDELMSEIADTRPLVTTRQRMNTCRRRRWSHKDSPLRYTCSFRKDFRTCRR